MAALGEPVTMVTEALRGQRRPARACWRSPSWRSPEPSEPELRFLSTLAGLTAQALERAQLFEQERQALRDAEAGRERLSLLSDVTKLLSSSLDPTTVMQRTMNLVVGRLCDACVVQVPGESGLQRLDVRGAEVFDLGDRPTPDRSGHDSVRLRRAGRLGLPDGSNPAEPVCVGGDRRRRATGRPPRWPCPSPPTVR